MSSGDNGAAGLVLNARGTECVPGTSRSVSEAAADPNVTGVGGSEFIPSYDANGQDVGSVAEAAWDDPSGATGGGKSQVFTKPSYQKVVTPNDGARDVPDVAYGASPNSPGFIFGTDSGGNPTLGIIGGTSIAAPMWAGLSRLVAQSTRTGGCETCPNPRLGNMNPEIYQLGALSDASSSGLRDVTSGSNSFNSVSGFSAMPGYDQTTGWGTADMATFVAAFASGQGLPPTATPSSTPTQSASATPTPTATPSGTPASPSPTTTPTSIPSATPTGSATPTPLPSPTPTSLPSATPTPAGPSPTPTVVPTPIPVPVGRMTVSPRFIRFGMHRVGTQSSAKIITVTNPGREQVFINSLAMTTSQFAIDAARTTCNVGAGVGSRRRCKIAVTFQPASAGRQTDSLTIQSNAINQPQSVQLQGTGEE